MAAGASLASVRGAWRDRVRIADDFDRLPDDLAATLIGGGAQPLPIGLEHAAMAERLPWHHRDPFDRLLIAQATIERAALISADERLHAYEVRVIW